MKGWWKSIAFWIWVLSVMLCSNLVWETFEASSLSLKLYTEADCQLCPWVTRTLIEVVSDFIKFLSTGTYAINYLILCRYVVFVIMNQKKKEKQKYQWMKKVLHKIWCFIITACVLIILVTNPWCTSLQDPQSYLIFTSQLNCQNLMIVRYEIEFRI